MKKRKIIAWLLMLACIISLLPANSMCASAEGGDPTEESTEESVGKITFVYFADVDQYISEPQFVEVTDSSKEAQVGGEVKWSYGMMFLEPEAGYTVKEVYYGWDLSLGGNENFNREGTLQVGTGADIQEQYSELQVGMSQAVADKLQASLDTAAVYLPREEYDKIKYKQIRVVMSDGTQDVTYKIHVTEDIFSHEGDPYWRINIHMGDTFNIFEASAGLKATLQEKGWKAEDFEVMSIGPTGSGEENALEKLDDNGTYKVVKHGVTYGAFLKNKNNGLEYRLFIMFLVDGPLSLEKITYSSNLGMDDWVFETGNLVFRVNTKEPTAKEMYVEMELAAGAEIDWSTATVGFQNSPLKVGTTTYTQSTNYYDGDAFKIVDVPVNITITEDTSTESAKYRVTFESDYNTQVGKLYFVAKDVDGNEYPYSFAFDPGDFGYYGNNGMGDYHLPANKEINIFDWMTFNKGIGKDEAAYKQEILDGINDGTYIFGMQGVEILRDENGKFQGNVKFTHPESYISACVYDPDTRFKIIDAGMPFCYHRSTVMELGSSIDLSDIFNGYWGLGYNVELLGENGFTYDNDTHILTAPRKLVNGVSTQKIYIKMDGNTYGEIWVFLSEQGKVDEVMTDQIKEAEEDQSFMVDVSKNVEATISADVLNALKDNLNKIDVSVKCESSSKAEIIWEFNNQELNVTADKALKLDVAVGDDAGDEQIDQFMMDNNASGLKVSFADNGKLPGKTNVRLGLLADELEKLGNKTKDLCLYYWDKTKNQMVKEQEALEILVDAKGKSYVEVPMTHNSDFVLADAGLENAKSVPVVSVADQNVTIEKGLSAIKTGEAKNTAGEKVEGTYTWSETENGDLLTSDYQFTGTAGEEKTLYWTFTPVDAATYQTVTGSAKFTLTAKIVPEISVNDITATYSGKALTDADIVGKAISDNTDIEGIFAFVDASELKSAGTYKVTVKFTPVDSEKYDVATQNIIVKISPKAATVGIRFAEGKDSIEVGDALPGVEYFEEGLVEGESFNTSQAAEVSGMPKDSSEIGSYSIEWSNYVSMKEAISKLSTAKNYSITYGNKAKLTILEKTKKTTIANAPTATMNVANSVAKVSEITLPTGWEWADADKDKILIAGGVTKATAVYNGSDKDEYVESALHVEISITRAASSGGSSGGGSSSGGSSGGGSSSGGSSGGGSPVAPTVTPTEAPTATPTPTVEPTEEPTAAPTVEPTEAPTTTPTEEPTVEPTVEPTEAPTTAPSAVPTAKPQNKPLNVGTKVAVSGITYKVTGKNAVSYDKVASKAKGKVVIADSVKIKGKTYRVTSVEPKAFRNNKKITNVVIGRNVVKIGKQAFYGCKNLKSITIKSLKLTEKKTGDKAFKGIHKSAVIKVPKSRLIKYKKILKAKGIGAKVKVKK